MRILGIDPALSITGFGVVDQNSRGLFLVDAGIVRTESNSALPVRLAKIYKDILRIAEELRPNCLILEKIFVHHHHPTTAYILGQARGVICLVSAQAHLPLFEYAATRVKKAVIGEGLASKSQIQRMVCSILGLSDLPKYQDITDALALAIAHSYIARSKQRLGI